MQVGERAYGGIYAGDHNGHHIIYSTKDYDLPCRVNWYQATEYCKTIGMELPSKEELNLLYKLYKFYRPFPEYFPRQENRWYWTSTESSSTDAWWQNFVYGYQYIGRKSDNYHIRPIKRIRIKS